MPTLTMPTTKATWSQTEEAIAREAFRVAYAREVESMMAEAKRQAAAASSPDELWELNDFLSARRHYLDGKYDFHPESLIFVFAQLVKEGWLNMDELSGFTADKLSKIRVLTFV